MSRLLTICSLVLVTSFVTGCLARVPFTQNMRDRYKLTPNEIKNLQFYLSYNVLLERRIASGQTVVSQNHKLVERSGQKVEQVAILAGTPGIVVQAEGDIISASFEEASHINFKMNPGLGGKYLIECVPAGGGCTVAVHTPKGPVEFQAVGQTKQAFLMIEQSRMQRYEHRISIQKGRTLE